MSAFVIAYDIADPRRLQRVHRCLRSYATPLEYSVFLLLGSERDRQRCLADLARLIDPKADDIRCYPLPERGFQGRLGRASLPPGIHWTGLPANIR